MLLAAKRNRERCTTKCFPDRECQRNSPLKLPSALIDCLLMSFWDFVECEHSDAVPSPVENIGLPALAVQCGSLDTKERRFVWVSGPSCAGKSTVTDSLTSHGLVRYEGDTWCVGGDPVRDPDLIPTPDLLRSSTEEHTTTVSQAIYLGRSLPAKGEPTSRQVWERFCLLLGTDVVQRCFALRHQDFSVAFAIYQQSERDFPRSLFGGSLTFVLLNVPEELLAERIKTRATQKAESKGMSLTQYINAFHLGRTVDQVLEVRKTRCSGFEPKQDGEPNTFQVDVTRAMSKDDAARKAAQLLDSIFHVPAPCESVLGCVEPLTLNVGEQRGLTRIVPSQLSVAAWFQSMFPPRFAFVTSSNSHGLSVAAAWRAFARCIASGRP